MVLEVNGLYKSYKHKGRIIEALKGISFSLPQGKRIGIVGASGSGKSTILKILSLLEKPSAGKVVVKKEEVWSGKLSKIDRYRNLQLVSQNAYESISPRMRIGDFLRAPLKNFDIVPNAEIETLVDQVLLDVELPLEVKHKYRHEVSGGQLQRIAIARALLIEPDVLLFDEPTSALDITTQRRILELIDKLYKKRGLSYILVGHDIEMVRKMTDHILVMHEGEIVEALDTNKNTCIATHPYTKRLMEASSLTRLSAF